MAHVHVLAEHITPDAEIPIQHPPVSPGKVAMWLFLATEVMFFTGLIGSYIVLRAGSGPTGYSNFFSPGTDLTRKADVKGVHLIALGSASEKDVAEVIRKAAGISEHEAEHLIESGHLDLIVGKRADAEGVRDQLEAIGAKAEVSDLKTYNWPVPYDVETNPLNIDLTAGNTFILICSSVTMVLALSAIQRGNRGKFKLFLGLTVLFGSFFVGVQVYEYYQLMIGHNHPIGISASHHFTPDASLFASCFFTMTGFHGAHVTGGVVMLLCLLIGAFMGKFSPSNYSPVELVGLYWHFVDLVWIILFTVVYLI